MAEIKGKDFLMQEDLVAFTLIVHGFWFDAIWKGGNVVWFFNRLTPPPYSPHVAVDSKIINKDWTQQTLPNMVYDALNTYELEHAAK